MLLAEADQREAPFTGRLPEQAPGGPLRVVLLHFRIIQQPSKLLLAHLESSAS